MGDESDYQPQKKTLFNSSGFKVLRMHELWQDANNHSRQGLLQKWSWDLDRIWLELIAHAEKDDYAKFKELTSRLSKNKGNAEVTYFILMEKEAFLRKMEDNCGLGVAYMDEDEDDL